MKVAAWCITYTGAHFRGFEDPLDGRPVMMWLEGDEQKISHYLLENFSYGVDRAPTIAGLVDGLQEGRYETEDGCGAIVRLWADGEELYKYAEQHEALVPGESWIDLGYINVDKMKKDSAYDHAVRRLASR